MDSPRLTISSYQLDGELIQLYDRRDRGENVDLVIRNKEEQKDGYHQAHSELKRVIGQEQILTDE